MALEAYLQQAILLNKVVDAMRTCGGTSTSIAATRALQVQSMGSSHVALVSLLLHESALADYRREAHLLGNECGLTLQNPQDVWAQ